jgi:hypothetical protein
VTATLTIPEALGDEDGERWYLQGHIEPALAVLAVLREQMMNVGPDEACSLLIGPDDRLVGLGLRAKVAELIDTSKPVDEIAFDLYRAGVLLGSQHGAAGRRTPWDHQLERSNELLNSVSHYWAKQDPSDDDRMLLCSENDAGAEAWTEVRA